MGQRQQDPAVVVSIHEQVAQIAINRPEAKNALNSRAFDGLESCLDQIVEAGDVRVLVITGSGGGPFCAGADLGEIAGLDGDAAHRLLSRGQEVFSRIESLGIPSIAAVRGWALGGGFELALSCTLIVASESAKFGLPEAGLGLMPGYGGTQRLPASIGHKAALAVMLTGEPLTADRAWQLGLLAAPPFADQDLADGAKALAERLASRGSQALRAILDVCAVPLAQERALRHEVALAALAIASSEASEGIDAFLNKRKPKFRGIQ